MQLDFTACNYILEEVVSIFMVAELVCALLLIIIAYCVYILWYKHYRTWQFGDSKPSGVKGPRVRAKALGTLVHR